MSNSIQPPQGQPAFVMLSPVPAPPAQRSVEDAEQVFPSMNGTTIAAAALVAGALAPIGVAAYLALRTHGHSGQLIEAGSHQSDPTGTLVTHGGSLPALTYDDPEPATDPKTGLRYEVQKDALCAKHALNAALMALGGDRVPLKNYLEAYRRVQPNGSPSRQIDNEELIQVMNTLKGTDLKDSALTFENQDKGIGDEALRYNARAMLVVAGTTHKDTEKRSGHWKAIVRTTSSETAKQQWHIVDSVGPHVSRGYDTLKDAHQDYLKNVVPNDAGYILIR